MIYLQLFLTFLKIGAVSFGGGYAMIPLVREEVIANGWLTESEFLNFIAVAESTPGPIAVNMATFVGSTQAGILGSLLATFGVVLPSFIIILLIVALFNNVLKLAGVKWALSGIKPVIAGLIIGTAVTMLLSNLFALSTIESAFSFDYKALIILAIIVVASFIYNKLAKKKPSPIILILLSAVLGILFYGL